MDENSVNRKLRAILSADAKGYSRLMGKDEVGTYQTLTSYLESIRSIISEQKGRVFSSPGDAVMAEFSSVVDAVQCAVEIQEKIEAANAEVPEDRKMQFRIGVNLGDVIQDGDQLYGDGVNIAARIETLADPGGVSIIYKNRSIKVQKVSEELGVRYVLEGSVRKDGNRTRITVQLIDAIKGHYLWADRYDRDVKDTFAVQEGISKKILTALEVNLTEGEQATMMAKGTSNGEAYIKVLQSTYYRRRLNAEDNAKARRLAEEAIALDNEYAVAYTTLSRTHVVDIWLRTTKSPRESYATAIELANKALALDDSLADAYDILGNILVLKRNHDDGIRHLERAIELEPNGADFQAHMGMALYLADRSQEAVQVLLKAIRLNPNPPSWYLHNLAAAFNFLENHDEAIFWGEKAVKLNPESLLGHYILCAIYSSAGRMENAKREALEILKINPKFSVSTVEKTNPLKNNSVKKRYFDSLRKAGLPE